MNTSDTDAVSLASEFKCPISTFPQTYLGLPLSATKLKLSDMQLLICKHDRYLSGGTRRLLNTTGCTALSKASLSSLPVYAMCAIDVPASTLDALMQQQRAFIWTGNKECHGAQCKVAWEVVTLPKAKEGLDVKDLRTQNQCLLGKFGSKLMES